MSQSFQSEIRNPHSAIPRSALARRVREFTARAEFGDALLVFYFVVFVRPWFWALDNLAAWFVTVPLALVGWYFYVSTKEKAEARPSASFWLIVALPLLFVYMLRAPFPDASFDVWSLRLFHGERGLRGFLYRAGEFFPTSAPFNPTPDMLTGLFRHLLGYRLGTIINLLALIWAGTIVEKLLRPYVRSQRLRAACVLLALWTEHLLFEVNNYMVDLLALPLMLEATRLVLEAGEREVEKRYVVRVAFLVGASVALKLSNGAVAAPLVAVCAWRALARRPLKMRELATDALVSLAVFAAPLVPFMVWVYKWTGSPVFPIYNGYFKSPFYPLSNGWDGRWGGFGPWEILAWPVQIFFEPQRTAELSVYSGRLSVAFIAALACLIFARRLDARTRTLAFLLTFGSLVWSLTMGYIRYGLYLEVLSGVLLVGLASQLARASSSQSGVSARDVPRWRVALAALVCALLVAQSALASLYVSRQEWSMRPTVFQQFGSYVSESKYLLRDRSIRAWLTEREREMFDRVEVWVVSGAKTAGLMPFLNDRAPFVGVRSAGLFVTPASREELSRVLERYEGRRIYSLSLTEDFAETLFVLRSVGLEAGRVNKIVIPFYSPSAKVNAYFFEVRRATDANRQPPARTESERALASGGFVASLQALDAPTRLKAGETPTLFFRVRNGGDAIWPALARKDGKYRLALRARWLAAVGAVEEEARATLPYDLPPGESVPLPLNIRAPLEPGEYVLEVGMIQEGVATFQEMGLAPLLLRVRVER